MFKAHETILSYLLLHIYSADIRIDMDKFGKYYSIPTNNKLSIYKIIVYDDFFKYR